MGQFTKEDVYEELKEKIMSLQYKPGTFFNEMSLAAEYDVSRTIIREVLRGLKDNYGFVEIIPRGGTYVSELHMREFKDIFEVKSELEGLAAELVLQRIDPQQAEELRELVQQIRDVYQRNMNHNDYIKFDMKFHKILRKACGNAELAHILESYHIRCTRLWYYICTDIADEVFIDDYVDFYEKGIVQKNTEYAKKVMKGHTDKFVELIKTKLF